MAISTAAPLRVVTRLEWLVLILLVFSVAINYVDRGILSVTGVALSKELDLKPHELGYLLSAFFWTYAGFQLISGWLIDRYNVLLVFAAGFAVWSTATALTGLAKGFAALFILRLLLGVGESVAYPFLFENHCRRFSGAPARNRQWPDRCRMQAGPGGRHDCGRVDPGPLRLAHGLSVDRSRELTVAGSLVYRGSEDRFHLQHARPVSWDRD